MEGKVRKKKNLWNFADYLEGDKVVWIIVILLILFSIVAIFSSTSQITFNGSTSRMEIVGEQLILSAAGLALILICCKIPKIGFFSVISQLGYVASMIPLLLLVIANAQSNDEMKLGFMTVEKINSAWRIIRIGGFQFHVFEFVKVAMVMYVAWAVNALRNDRFLIANILGEKYPIWKKKLTKEIVYIYFPVFSVCLCMMVGSLSSTLFIGAILIATFLIGGVKIRLKELLPVIGIGAALLCICIVINISIKDESKKLFPHLDTAIGRLTEPGLNERLKIMENSRPYSTEFQEAYDKAKQPASALIAIKEGKIIGKGPGKSTQRYVVAIMYEDYMFSFIVEEYGLLGAVIVLVLYISLLARGAIIVRNCENQFAKTAVAGLILLITGQAMMHIAVNCDIIPLTGQTLPMVSRGNSSFLMFSIAFGIILSISKMAKKKIEREAAQADPLVDRSIKNEAEASVASAYENEGQDYGSDDSNNE